MRILILGGNGMIGHKVYQILSGSFEDIWVTLRNNYSTYEYSAIYNSSKVIDSIDLSDLKFLGEILDKLVPDVIINACGVTIRRGVGEYYSKSILLNSVLPHFLDEWVSKNNKRLIHFSTDCVFSGIKGSYVESDLTDAKDLYGKSKALGEVINSQNTLTLRGSMIGFELENKTELLEWAISKKNSTISGFANVFYSGITTIRMAYFVQMIINKFPHLSGIFHISSLPISKFELLKLINSSFSLSQEIEPKFDVVSNKVLVSNRIYDSMKLKQPSWEELILELKEDYLKNEFIYR